MRSRDSCWPSPTPPRSAGKPPAAGSPVAPHAEPVATHLPDQASAHRRRPSGTARPQHFRGSCVPATDAAAFLAAGQPRSAETSTTACPGPPARPAPATCAVYAATITDSATRHPAGPCAACQTAASNGRRPAATGSPPTRSATAPTTTCHRHRAQPTRHRAQPAHHRARRQPDSLRPDTSRCGNASSVAQPHPRSAGTTHRPSEHGHGSQSSGHGALNSPCTQLTRRSTDRRGAPTLGRVLTDQSVHRLAEQPACPV
jgi:hypothetical protein